METFFFYLVVIAAWLFVKLSSRQQRTTWGWDIVAIVLLAGGAGFAWDMLA